MAAAGGPVANFICGLNTKISKKNPYFWQKMAEGGGLGNPTDGSYVHEPKIKNVQNYLIFVIFSGKKKMWSNCLNFIKDNFTFIILKVC